MKKRIISLLLALSMMISLVPVSALADTGGGTTPLAAGGGSRTTNNSGSTISGGVHDDNISNFGTIEAGTFNGQVTNWYSGQIHHGIFNNDVWNDGLIMGGTFKGTVTNHKSSTGVPGIANGTGYKPIFVGKVINEGTVNGGIFLGDFVNETTTTSGNAVTGKVKNGIFKDDPEIDNVKSITVNGAAIKEVGYCDATEYDMSWGTTVYAASGTGVVIHVDTKVNAINGKDPSEFNGGLYDDGQMIIFTMPDEPVVLSYIAPKDLQFGEDGKPTAASGNGWTYDGTTLKLTSGEWNFLNDPEIRCNVDISKDAVLKDGTINATVKNYGTIEGGTIRFCDNYGTIVNGTFDNPNKLYCIWNYNLISGGVFEQGIQACVGDGMASKITGGTFKSGFYTSGSGEGTTVTGGTFASPPTNATGKRYSVSIGSWSGKCSIAINGVDFGENKSVYVVGQDYNDVKITATAFDAYVDADTNKTKKFKEWQISPTGATLNAVDGGTADLTQKEIEFFMPDSYKNITLAAKYETVTTPTYDENLVIGTDGKPVTENREPYGNGGVQGEGWTYINDTLTLSGTFEFDADANTRIDCSVVVGNGAKLSNAAVVGSNATVTNNGTITNCYFGNPSVTVINNREISNSIFATKPNGTGTLLSCLFASNEELTDCWTVDLNYSEDETAYAGLQNNPFKMSVNKFYVIADASGTLPTITLSENPYNGPLPAQVMVTAPDGAWWTQEINNNSLTIVQPTYKLTLVNAELVGMTGTEFTKNATIKIKPKFDDEELELASWTSDTDKFNVNTITKNGDGTYTLKMPGNALKLTANGRKKTYSLTVVNGYIGDATNIRSGSFEKGAQITIVADAPAIGFAFVGWNALNGTTCPVFSSADKDTRTYKFKMPAEKVELEAVYKLTGSGELVLVNGVPDINNAIRRDVHENVTTYFGRGWEYRVSDETDPSKNLLLLTGENFVLDKNSSSDSLKCNLEIGEYTSVKGTIPLTQAVKIEGAVDGMYFDGAKVTVDTIGRVTNSILHNVTVTNNDNIKNCVSDTKLPGAQELTEAGGATVTATLDGCAGEVSGETLYFTGTPTLKVKVKGATVEKANGEDVGQADENGWYTVTAAEDGNIKLTKSTPTPNPDDQPTTYTVTVKGGKINNKTEEKAKKGIELTVDVDEKEVPEGMTFDVWSIRFPKGVKDTLTGNPSVKLHDPHMTFTMPGADITIEAQYRSSELPGEDDGPSTLGTMATVAVGGAAAGILVWQGVSLGVDSYLQLNLPQGVAVPTNRRELVVLLWETAGKPEAALPSLYSDLPAEEIELQKATRWAIDNGLVKPADDSDASRFDPDRYVTKYDVFGAWLKLKKLMK